MARHDSNYDLTDTEKRDLIKLIEQGKTREVCTAILPFQTLEHIDEPRKEAADLGKFGIHATRKRLIGVQRALKSDGKSFRAFEVPSFGRYERQA